MNETKARFAKLNKKEGSNYANKSDFSESIYNNDKIDASLFVET